MSAHRVFIEPRAERDLRRRALEIAEDSPENAARWLERISEAILDLECFPRRWPRAPEDRFFEDFEIRHMIVRGYRVIFALTERSVHVLHVRHGARRWASRDDLGPAGDVVKEAVAEWIVQRRGTKVKTTSAA